MDKPNFFLIGAPKCGTTAVANTLGRHPEIFISEPKEPCYFLYTRGNPYGFSPDARISDYGRYMSLFKNANGAKVIGEASPLYIHAPYVAEEIANFNPEAKIVAIIRQPVERAYSMYLFWNQYERHPTVTPQDFREKFLNGTLRSQAAHGCATMTMEFLKSFGFYFKMLKPYFQVFPCNQILVVPYDDLKSDGVGFVRRLLAFLGASEAHIPEVLPDNVTLEPRSRELHFWLNLAIANRPRRVLKRLIGFSRSAKAARDLVNQLNQKKTPLDKFLSKELRGELTDIYREDLVLLSKLTGRDFTPWASGMSL